MTSHADKKLQDIELHLKQEAESPKAYFKATDATNGAGKTEKATPYLRIALTIHENQLLNQYNIKSIGDSNNA